MAIKYINRIGKVNAQIKAISTINVAKLARETASRTRILISYRMAKYSKRSTGMMSRSVSYKSTGLKSVVNINTEYARAIEFGWVPHKSKSKKKMKGRWFVVRAMIFEKAKYRKTRRWVQ